MLTDQNKINIDRLNMLLKAAPDIIKNILIDLGNQALNDFSKNAIPKRHRVIISDYFKTNKQNGIIKKDK